MRHATGVPYAEWIVRAAAGLDISLIRKTPVRRYITRHCLMAEEAGIFSGFDFDVSVQALIIDQLIWGKNGEEVIDAISHKFGIVFLEYLNLINMRHHIPELQKMLQSKINLVGFRSGN